MLISGFGVDGWVRRDPVGTSTAELVHRRLEDAPSSSPVAGGPFARLVQRELADPRPHGRPADRLALVGWIDAASSPAPGDGDSYLRALQDVLDRRGAAVLRELRGDFVLVHVDPRGEGVQVLRAVEAMIPMFWRVSDDEPGTVRLAADPLKLFPAGPRLDDVDLGALPMVLSERGLAEDRSWFAGVSRLPNGARLRVRRDGTPPAVDQVDELSPWGRAPRTLAEAADGVRDRLAAACGRMLAGGDGGVVALSGGMDSGAVAVELGRHAPGATALHYTLEGFPGFAQDREAATSTATAAGLRFVPYGMEKHTMAGGDYVAAGVSAMPPQTHVPLTGVSAAAVAAEADGARFVLSGLLSDQVFAHDMHTSLMQGGLAAMLNPLVAGEPVWQTISALAGSSFGARRGPGVRETVRYLGALRRGDPTVALPARDVVAHPIGLTPGAADQVTVALRASAQTARDRLTATTGRGRRLPAGLTSMFFIRQMVNTANLQAAWLNHCLPRRRFLRTPYADRDLVEYALTLPTHHRVGSADGLTVDKLALRTAYVGRELPRGIGGRMHQARIDAIPAVFAAQNARECLATLGPASILRSRDVLDAEFVARLTPENIHRNGEEVARLCAVERWLQTLAG